ncbi:MAG: glycosyltransferase [Rhodothermaceae bacterium]|nr:glycosyltransferase [Rhodothermaceae bacterium]
MDRNNLLLYTHEYPYGLGETFLETEINYLAKTFNRIIIIPCKSTTTVRSVPDGIKINDSLAKRADKSSLSRLFEGITASLLNSFTIRELISMPSLFTNQQSFYRLFNMQGGAKWVHRITHEILRDYNMNPNETVAYSYWLDFSTLGITRPDLKRRGLKTVSRGHGYDIYDFIYSPPYIPYKKKIMNDLDQMVFISENGRNYTTSRIPSVSERSVISRLGVHDPGFISKGTGEGHLHIVSCSKIVPVKQLHLLVDALVCLGKLSSRLKVRWTHIGDGPLEGRIMKECKDKLPQNIRYIFAGQLSNREVMEFYRNNEVDVLVNVSSSEGIPVTMMEAQSCGISVCARAVGGVPEIVDNNNGSLLRKDSGPVEIAEALILFAEAEYRSHRSKLSRLNWEKNYNAEKNYSEFCSILKNI